MKAIATAALALAAMAISCSSPAPTLRETAGVFDQASSSGLTLRMDIPGERFSTSGSVPVYLRLTNMTDKDIVVNSPTDQKVTVTIYEPTPVGWKKVKDYPEIVTAAPQTWTLGAGKTQIVDLPLAIGPDWPNNSDVRIEARVNGRPELRTSVQVFILPSMTEAPTPR